MATSSGRRIPPQVLAELLAEDKAAGFEFAGVFSENVRCAAGGSRSWLEALTSVEAAWRASWDNDAPAARAGSLSLDLTDDPEHLPTGALPA